MRYLYILIIGFLFIDMTEEDWKFECSTSLCRLLSFEHAIPSSEISFCTVFERAINFQKTIEEIKSLPETIVLKKVPPEKENAKFGTVYVLKVEVVCEKNNLKVLEKVCI